MSDALTDNGQHGTKLPAPGVENSDVSSAKTGRGSALRFSKRQILLALGIAAISDAVCGFVVFAPPAVWATDVLTAILLFAVLGWQWLLLPGLVLEAIPGLGVIPFWLLVVGAILLWGTARPKFK
ncbi:MAG TPA: hypothetical protein VFG04_10780 [Planctomycetaceae bacterium]|jgi:hypothetical protein|nr:hypothetical protein [Planctomycetaceae bacterium]